MVTEPSGSKERTTSLYKAINGSLGLLNYSTREPGSSDVFTLFQRKNGLNRNRAQIIVA